MSILRLKEILKEQDTTGKELALKVGVSQPAMSDIVKGKSYPRPALLLKIAETLDIDLKDLFISTKKTDDKNIYLIMDDRLHVFKTKASFIDFVVDTDEPLRKFIIQYSKNQE